MKKILVATLFWAISAPARAETEWAELVEAGSVHQTRVTGRIAGAEGATRIEAARVPGRIVKILRREGETINVGAALFEINSPECTSLAEEKRVAEKRGLVDLEQAANLRYRQLNLEIENGNCKIVSASAGTIVKRQVELGAAFNSGDALMTVLDTRNLIVELDVPERALGTVKENQKVDFTLAARPRDSLHSTVERILPLLDPVTRATKVRLRPVSLPKGTALDSLVFAEFSGGTASRLLRAPATAFVFNRNQQWVVKEARPSPVAVPIEIVDEADASSVFRPREADALKVGDRVAVRGALFLFNRLQAP